MNAIEQERLADEAIDALRRVHSYLLTNENQAGAAMGEAVSAVFGPDVAKLVCGEVRDPDMPVMMAAKPARRLGAADRRALREIQQTQRILQAHYGSDDMRRRLTEHEAAEASRIADALFHRR